MIPPTRASIGAEPKNSGANIILVKTFEPAVTMAMTPDAQFGRITSGGTIYGVIKTTVYLPDSLKKDVERQARQRSCSEAEVIRQAIQDAVSRPKPQPGIIGGDSDWAERVDELLDGFGER